MSYLKERMVGGSEMGVLNSLINSPNTHTVISHHITFDALLSSLHHLQPRDATEREAFFFEHLLQ